MQQPSARSPRGLWTLFAASSLVCIGLFFIPAFIIQPFRHQSPRALSLALVLRQRAPLGTLVVALICLLLAVALWRFARRWQRVVLAAAMVLVAFSAVMARLNYFEWMFHPVRSPQFEAEAQSKLDAAEMIMAVRLGNDARAYPISEMAYHHIVNDMVGAVPVAVTY
jgi:Protein of unknown function (DUF3179)